MSGLLQTANWGSECLVFFCLVSGSGWVVIHPRSFGFHPAICLVYGLLLLEDRSFCRFFNRSVSFVRRVVVLNRPLVSYFEGAFTVPFDLGSILNGSSNGRVISGQLYSPLHRPFIMLLQAFPIDVHSWLSHSIQVVIRGLSRFIRHLL